MLLSREEIVAAIAARSKEVARVDVPEWGGEVCVRRLTAAEVEATGLTDDERNPNMPTRFIAACLADEAGAPLFTAEETTALAVADMAVTARVFGECIRVNGLMSSSLQEAVASFADAQPESSSSS
jgi:hypothetical protein